MDNTCNELYFTCKTYGATIFLFLLEKITTGFIPVMLNKVDRTQNSESYCGYVSYSEHLNLLCTLGKKIQLRSYCKNIDDLGKQNYFVERSTNGTSWQKQPEFCGLLKKQLLSLMYECAYACRCNLFIHCCKGRSAVRAQGYCFEG